MADEFSERFGDHLTGSHDCVDRIVLNASMASSGRNRQRVGDWNPLTS